MSNCLKHLQHVADVAVARRATDFSIFFWHRAASGSEKDSKSRASSMYVGAGALDVPKAKASSQIMNTGNDMK